MLVVLSPSKTQDFSGRRHGAFSQPALIDQSKLLADGLKNMNEEQISRLMKVSDKLAEATCKNFQEFAPPVFSGQCQPGAAGLSRRCLRRH